MKNIPEHMNLCQVLSWIAFRDEHFVTSDPHKLRRDMQHFRKRVVELNPARDFLNTVRSGQLKAKGLFSPTGDVQTVETSTWSNITEDELWQIVEYEWKRIKEIQ
jgi:hypothetical protein